MRQFCFALLIIAAAGTLAQTRVQAADASRFEYKTVVLSPLSFSYSQLTSDRGQSKETLQKGASALDAVLNDHAKDGWRLVQTLPVRAGNNQVVGYALVLERGVP